ncbi:MAG TPA: DNA polymerase III subunit alpha [Bacteroidales bacterium]|nr:DNA polymerase III subunit alpha [Bacteroidales bacterium]
MIPFVHLHVHSQYSILDGQASIASIVDKAVADGMKAVALTDHGNMFGVKEFFNYVRKKNKGKPESEQIKPIIGCEIYVARNGRLNQRKEVKDDARGWHLILLAKNYQGYKNLLKIVSNAWTEGFYYVARTDHEQLAKYHEGLIACSACLGGEIPRYVASGQFEKAEASIQWFKDVFGEDFYLELQRHKPTVPNAAQDTYPKQQEVNRELIRLSKQHGVKLIGTNDVHFVDEIHAEAHHRLICLNTGRDLDDMSGMAYTKQEWFKTQEEMNEVFSDLPEALLNTAEIADKVEAYSIDHKPIMPNFPLPDGFDNDDDYLRHLTYEGAKRFYPEMTDEVRERLDFELSVIKNMGFPGYFLIVQDFTTAARSMGVSVGPGRGSAAGSVVAYCLGITQVDPIKYDLLFERFLNPDRISMPDIDIDFDDDGRGEVLRWVENRYGKDKVAHIITYGTMAAKSAIKDVARVQRLPLSESERLAKLIPDKIPDVKKVNLKSAIQFVPDLKTASESDNPVMRDTMKYAQMLEGNVRNIGVHACGVIIGRDTISDWVPISTADDKETGEKLLVTQYEGSVIEETGMIKMDFLGLKTLSIIKDALENIRLSHGEVIDMATVPLDDVKTYELYSAGKTVGTFQFESSGMQKYLRELQPTKFEDLIAMNALYRPGPMDYIPQFIARKQGREPIQYDIPVMERYLQDTYGITVYQEQVMLLSRLLANFTRGQSDELRKAMGKKIIEKLNDLKPKFIEGGKANGHEPSILNKIWADWEKFASYAFNKSHATCYSLVAYQTAWLKANYPSQYMAAVLSRSVNNITDITKFMDECRSMGIQVLGPNVNESNLKFTVNKEGNIRFGLGAIKGVGENAVNAILEERKNGVFRDVYDFMERVNLNACNKKSIESMAMAGSFDNIGSIKREQFLATNNKGETFLDLLVRYGNKFQLDKSIMTNSLFGGDNEIEVAKPEPPMCEPWPELIRLNREKELVGMYLSAHPLDSFYVAMKYVCNTTMEDIRQGNLTPNKELTFGGIVTDVRERTNKKNELFAFVTVEDYSGSVEIPFWAKDYVEFGKYLKPSMFLFMKGNWISRPWNPMEMELKIRNIRLLGEISENAVDAIHLSLPLSQLHKVEIENLYEMCKAHPGKTNLELTVVDYEEEPPIQVDFLSRSVWVNPSFELVQFLEELEYVEIKMKSDSKS